MKSSQNESSRFNKIVASNIADRTAMEAYRSIRTNFIFATSKHSGCKKVVISSPLPRDGKSTTCANLAVSLAQTGVKVLLIDCDMRKPRAHHFFKVSNIPGLSNVLAGFNSVSESIVTTEYSNVYFLPSGIVPPNPAELLSGPNMQNLLEGLEYTFDYILIDTPPVNLVSDALLLTKISDGMILVVKEDVTSHPELVKAIKNLQFAGTDILGIILNDTQGKKTKRYKDNYYNYQYAEDDGYEEK